MQARFFKFYQVVVLVTIFLYPVFSYSFQNQTVQQIDSSNVKIPSAIAVTDIIKKIEETNEEIKTIERKIHPSSSVTQIDSLYPIYVRFIKEQKIKSKNFIKANPNRQKVNNLIIKWDGYYDHLKHWERTINEYIERNTILNGGVTYKQQIWKLTYKNAVAEKVPPEVLRRIKITWNDVKKTEKSILDRNNFLLKLESKIYSQKFIVNGVIEELTTLKNSDVYHMLYLRHLPLWKESLETSEKDDGDKDEVESISENVSGFVKFIKTSESTLYLYFIVVILIVLLVFLLKKVFAKYEFNEENADLQYAKDIIFKRSVYVAIYLSLILANYFFVSTPMLFTDILFLLILIVSIPLVQPYMYKRFKKIVYFIVLFYVLNSVKTYYWFTSPQYRVYLLFEAILVIVILFSFTYPYLKTRKMKIRKFGLFLIRATPVIYLLSLISIISNILGYTNLADISLKISTQIGVLTMIFYAALMIAGGITTGLIHRHFNRQGSFDQKRKFNIEKRSLQVIRTFIFAYWFLYFLQMVDLLLPMTEFFTDLLTEPYVMRSMTFTIGNILTFILILAISYIITNFISFLLDEEGDSLKVLNLSKGVPAAISLVVRYFIFAFGFVLALSALGVDLSKFNLMAGALGLGIGFGLQTVISNFVSGLILVFERPILPGDTVEVNNLLGTVNRIGIRSSNIRTFDGAEVIVPNNNLIANDLINWTLSDNIKRVEILIGTTYGSDPNEILKILLEVVNENKDALQDPPAMALFSEFGDSSLNFKLRFWVPYELGLEAKSDVSIGVYNRFKELGIEIPFPQQDVYIKDFPKKEEDAEVLKMSKKNPKSIPAKKKNPKKNNEPLQDNSGIEGDSEQ